jgi:hypothetical protein
MWQVYNGMKFIKKRYYKDKNKYNESIFKILKLFFFNVIISYYESNFLFASSAIFLQLINISFSTVFNTISFFCMIPYTYHLISFYISLYRKINVKRLAHNFKNLVDKFSILIEDIKYNLHEFDRFNYRRRANKIFKNWWENFLIINYHIIGYIKKLLLLFCIFLSEKASKTALSLGISLYLF